MNEHATKHDAIPERLVPLEEVCRRVGKHRVTVYRMIRRGASFPRLRSTGSNRKFVLESELVAWMRSAE